MGVLGRWRRIILWRAAILLFFVGSVSAVGAQSGQGLSFRLGQVLTGVPHALSQALADVDGDGDLDLFVGTYFSRPDLLFLNDGKGHFRKTGPWRFHGLATETFQEDFLDVDGDGDLDLFLGTHRAVRLLFNDGKGFFGEKRKVFPPLLGRGPNFWLGDLDGDGDEDLLVQDSRRRRKELVRAGIIRYHLNQGKGRFSPPVTLIDLPGSSCRPFSFDIDGDGLQEILVTTYPYKYPPRGYTLPMLFLNLGGLKFKKAPSDWLPKRFGYSCFKDGMFGYGRLLAGDIDGDGSCDLAYPGWGRGRPDCLTILLNQKGKGFKEDPAFRELQEKWFEKCGGKNWSIPYPMLHDLDGDGRLDLVTAVFGRKKKNFILFFLNRGKSGFQVSSLDADLVRDKELPRPVLAGDLNGDGVCDLIVEYGYGGWLPSGRKPVSFMILLQEGKREGPGRGPVTPGVKRRKTACLLGRFSVGPRILQGTGGKTFLPGGCAGFPIICHHEARLWAGSRDW